MCEFIFYPVDGAHLYALLPGLRGRGRASGLDDFGGVENVISTQDRSTFIDKGYSWRTGRVGRVGNISYAYGSEGDERFAIGVVIICATRVSWEEEGLEGYGGRRWIVVVVGPGS